MLTNSLLHFQTSLKMADLEAQLHQAAHDALVHWDIDVGDIELFSRSENIVFKVTSRNDVCFALRIHRPGYNTLAEMESELTWTDALNAAGLKTPAHIPTKTGVGYATVEVGLTDSHHVGVSRWEEGDLLQVHIDSGDSQQAASSFSRLGYLIASLHNQTSSWIPSTRFTRRRWDANGLVGSDPLWGKFWQSNGLSMQESKLLARVRRRVHEELTALPTDRATFGLIHADLHPRNVLVTPNELVAIDFDDCGFGWHYYDIAVALTESQQHPSGTELQTAFLAAYRAERSLPDAEGKLPLFFLIRSLVSLGWINARPELATSEKIRSHADQILEEVKVYLDQSDT
jgi:Ser/Thr protein kinase RdoA (MazF antagonist)